MEIILLQDVENLGTAGDILQVAPGYARNYLFPKQLALRASKRNLAISEEKKRIQEARRQRELRANQALAERLSKLEITIEVQVGEEEKIFGVVTTKDIQSALEDSGVEIERHNILLEEPIKGLGIYHVPVRISDVLKPEIKVYVIKA